MRAVIIEEFGTGDQFKMVEMETPQIRNDEVLIQVRATSVNAVDWMMRAGYLKDAMHLPLPLIVGLDFAGIVKKVGDSVREFNVGDEVFSRKEMGRPGTLAEYVVLPASKLARKPAEITFEEASAIPTTGLTALQALTTQAKVMAGEKVLILGGAGGVGSFAIQLAKHLGAEVTTTTSGKNEEFVRTLGADHIINYENEDFSKGEREFDVVLDTVGGENTDKAYGVVKEGGRLVTIAGKADQEKAKANNIQVIYFTSTTEADQLEKIAALAVEGKVRIMVTEILPFTNQGIREAHSISESGHARGKIVISIR
jgi:NADPH:quinone reductase-like Zn-dependent oxidoreductase